MSNSNYGNNFEVFSAYSTENLKTNFEKSSPQANFSRNWFHD
ncbi:hypothetical protein APA_2065 [Pseudanabaena sp. lw0831]|nr:hypothetical protein APA_2065 [Pseudanabaena sp. lw0831]